MGKLTCRQQRFIVMRDGKGVDLEMQYRDDGLCCLRFYLLIIFYTQCIYFMMQHILKFAHPPTCENY